MANLSDKAIKIFKKKHQIENKLLFPKGLKIYFLKIEGRTKKFTILATFDNYGAEFDRYRNSQIMAFAVGTAERFQVGAASKTMREIAEISDNIATVEPSGESVVYAIKKGDEYKPFYMDFTYKFFVHQTGNRFDPLVDA